ncbi:MAG: hypothetical protein ACKO7N_00360 [Candidatus Nitrosotenuis sp.]
MNSNNPIQNYDKLSVNLAVTSFYKPDGNRDLNIALRVIPTKVDENGVSTLDNEAYTVYRGSLMELKDETEQTCVGKMIVALQEFINSRGW